MNNESEWQSILTSYDASVHLKVKITPGSSKNRILGPHGDALKISINAAPEKGKANQTLISFLGKVLKIPRQNISVISGPTSPIKTLQLINIEIEACKKILQNEIKRV